MRAKHFNSKTLLAAVAAAVALSLPSVSFAQNAATANASAVVQQPVVVSKSNDLAFGNVFPGLNKTVAVTDAGAAAFSISGQSGANVNLTFTLPTALASGANSLPLATWTARRNATNSAASGTDFTPGASATSATLSGAGAMYVFVGATAQPGVALPAGTYTGTLSLTVVYF
ncbi:MAG TPA: DUF4402 domain-containing protein [Gemmatimonadaceae bacterium]|jgi:hypothetical protein